MSRWSRWANRTTCANGLRRGPEAPRAVRHRKAQWNRIENSSVTLPRAVTLPSMSSSVTVSEAEIATMKSIASQRWQAFGPHVDHHIGDIAWGLRDRSLPTRVVMVEDRAYALFHEDPYKFGARPGDEDVYGDLIEAVGENGIFWALDSETDKVEALASRGYVAENDGHTWHLARELDDLPDVQLPDGWSIQTRPTRRSGSHASMFIAQRGRRLSSRNSSTTWCAPVRRTARTSMSGSSRRTGDGPRTASRG